MSVPHDDRGLLLGDGLFETVLARDGELALMGEHVRRMQAGAAVIGLAEPAAEDLVAAALGALGAASLQTGRAAVRLTLTAGSGRIDIVHLNPDQIDTKGDLNIDSPNTMKKAA